MIRKLLNGCVVVLAAFICPMSMIAAAGAASFVVPSPQPDDVHVQVDAPVSVTTGDPFVVDVAIVNLADSVQTLDNIDLSVWPLEVVEVLDATPAFNRNSRYMLLEIYWFEREIAAGETLNVSLYMLAHEPGTHTIELGICINLVDSCLPLEVVVDAR